MVVGTIVRNGELINEIVDDICRAGHQRGACVYGNLAISFAKIQVLVCDRDVMHADLPIPRVRHRDPEDIAGHARLLVLTEADLAWLGVSSSEKDSKQVGLQDTIPDHAIKDVEVWTFGHLLQPQAEDAIKRHQAEWLV